jgi:putative endonuclease
MHYLYILKCKDGSYYTGITWDLDKRVKEHNSRIKSPLQKSKIPVSLVYSEPFRDRYQAAKREKENKGWRREKKEALFKK